MMYQPHCLATPSPIHTKLAALLQPSTFSKTLDTFSMSILTGSRTEFLTRQLCNLFGRYVEQRGVLRQVYFSTSKVNLTGVFLPNRTNVVVHQRRMNKFDTRCSIHPNEYFIQIMAMIRTKHLDAHFHVVSQSVMKQPFPERQITSIHACQELSSEQFEDFEAFGNTSLHLDQPLPKAIHMIVMADILITSQSSFTYSAAVHSTGQVYSTKFWHTDLHGWISCSWNWMGDHNEASCG